MCPCGKNVLRWMSIFHFSHCLPCLVELLVLWPVGVKVTLADILGALECPCRTAGALATASCALAEAHLGPVFNVDIAGNVPGTANVALIELTFGEGSELAIGEFMMVEIVGDDADAMDRIDWTIDGQLLDMCDMLRHRLLDRQYYYIFVPPRNGNINVALSPRRILRI